MMMMMMKSLSTYGDLMLFKMVALCHLGFSKIQDFVHR